MSSPTYPLLGDLDDVPDEYVRTVAEAKRLMERWTMDPGYRDRFAADHGAALAELGLSITPDDARRLVEPTELDRVRRDLQDVGAVDGADVVVRYWAFIEEKLHHRDRIMELARPTHPAFAAWRDRQVARARGQLGPGRASGNVHAPFAIELTKGCTVGCWFCGVAAPEFESAFRYTPENRRLWTACLRVLRDLIGPAAGQGFLYWATDPLDSPDYERLIADFAAVTGAWPQTTTAQAPRQVDRVREFLRAARAGGSAIDRFSILSLAQLRTLHRELTPVEMLRVECVPQNRESTTLKSRSGRALTVTDSRARQLVDESQSSTIACVTGFLLNMVDRTVRMVTPCDTSDRWPLGYWVLAESHFTCAEDLRAVLTGMLDEHTHPHLRDREPVSVRPDLTVTAADQSLELASAISRSRVHVGADAQELASALEVGDRSPEQIAVARWQHTGVPLASTYAVLGAMHRQALLDEEPALHDFGALERARRPRTRTAQPVEITARG